MTRVFRPSSNTRRRFLIGLAGWFAGSGLINPTYAKEKAMKTMTLWQVIEALPQQLPFTKAKIEALFSTSLIEKRRSTHTTFLEGGSVSLAQGCLISKIDLRLGNEANDPGFMVLNIGGTCTTIEHVRRHYGDLKIAGTPRGNSLDDVTSHSTMQPWGELSFSFKERNPDCLSSIAFDPKKPN